ncbi:BCR, YceG family protein [Candidatus Endobugula sertula]|uniref:Endolytic murein transglycosylase n=1 Tax=Candidatus Endobugula sertula TaxID=62101 RepID=A0A1D2QU74_9GAMM|nr:BCR, YceG family protein [Candidatus Endobugula sertula]
MLILFLIAVMTLSAFILQQWLYAPLTLFEDKVIIVERGDTLGKVAYLLEREGALHSAKLFIVYARLMNQTNIAIGEYLLKKNSNHKQLLSLLQSGDVINYSVTLIEGKTFKNFLTTLQTNSRVTTVLGNKNQQEILAELAINIKHPEGWFFPDTYQFSAGTTDKDILLQAYRKMNKVLNQEWEKKAENLPYNSAYEALIMASIIEKETGVDGERAEIAGVFVRRLQKGMRLQTDPTIIYGLGDQYKGNIQRKHLTQKTPYNTYLIDGLPPTPIAMPGREAIQAALNPASGKALYFVAKGDGSHYFSETLFEHNKAVRKYQIERRRKKYQSSPKKVPMNSHSL